MDNYPVSDNNKPGIITLMYHRINFADTDPWDICVSPENFEAQIRYLSEQFAIISSGELIQRVKDQTVESTCICISFDDGYADNYEIARPILEKYGCPATFFIPTYYTGSHHRFWWDELEFIFLHNSRLPDQLGIMISGEHCRYSFGEKDISQERWQLHRNWRWYDEPPTERCAAFLDIWEKLRPLPADIINLHMEELKQWAGCNTKLSATRKPMSDDQLVSLAENDLFTIGLHTHTHSDLSAHTRSKQKEDILQGKARLLSRYGLASSMLAYPYGRYNSDTIQIAEECGLSGCFTTKASVIDSGTARYEMGRYQVCNWDRNTFRDNLANWCATG